MSSQERRASSCLAGVVGALTALTVLLGKVLPGLRVM